MAAVATGLHGQLYLAAGDEIVVFDPVSGAVERWPAGGTVTGLATVLRSGTVAAVVDGAVRLFDETGVPLAGAGPGAIDASATLPSSPVPSPTPAAVEIAVPTTLPSALGVPGSVAPSGTAPPGTGPAPSDP